MKNPAYRPHAYGHSPITSAGKNAVAADSGEPRLTTQSDELGALKARLISICRRSTRVPSSKLWRSPAHTDSAISHVDRPRDRRLRSTSTSTRSPFHRRELRDPPTSRPPSIQRIYKTCAGRPRWRQTSTKRPRKVRHRSRPTTSRPSILPIRRSPRALFMPLVSPRLSMLSRSRSRRSRFR